MNVACHLTCVMQNGVTHFFFSRNVLDSSGFCVTVPVWSSLEQFKIFPMLWQEKENWMCKCVSASTCRRQFFTCPHVTCYYYNYIELSVTATMPFLAWSQAHGAAFRVHVVHVRVVSDATGSAKDGSVARDTCSALPRQSLSHWREVAWEND